MPLDDETLSLNKNGKKLKLLDENSQMLLVNTFPSMSCDK